MPEKKSTARERRALESVLCALRNEAGLRQIDLADRLGKPQSFVSKYESGERRLDLIELRQICKVLNISLAKFLDRFEREAE